MKTLITMVVLFGLSAVAEATPKCDYRSVESDMAKHFGLSKTAAHGYRLSLENLNVNLELSEIRLAEDIYTTNLLVLEYNLMKTYGLTNIRAASIIKSIEMIRLNKDETGAIVADRACLGN